MSERYSRLSLLPENLYIEGSPLIIKAGALLKDNQTGKTLAQLKFENISKKPVKAVFVSVKAHDIAGNELKGVDEFQYLDLAENRGSNFGQKTAIFLPDNITRNIECNVSKVIFDDNSVWETTPDANWEPLKKRTERIPFKDYELEKQFHIEYGENFKYEFEAVKDLWYCTCGGINHTKEKTCHTCNKSFTFFTNLNIDELEEKKNSRLEAEQEAAAAAAVQDAILAEKAKKTRKVVLSIVIPCIVIFIFTFLYMFLLKDLFTYGRALSLMDKGKYEDAINTFETLGEYKDCEEQIKNCENSIKDLTYHKAIELLNSGEYEAAYTAFSNLDGYLDSDEYVIESQYCMASEYIKAKDFDKANEILKTISDYKDSEKLIHTHKFKGTVTLPAKCTEEGIKTFTCENDGCINTYTEQIAPTGHDYKERISLKAKCKEDGEKILTCKVCNFAKTEVIKATGHSYQSLVTTSNGCTNDGVMTYTCDGCGDSYTEVLPATGHSWKDATCTTPEKCSGCGKTGTSAYGHNWEYDYWYEDGDLIEYCRCSRCQQDYIPNVSVVGTNIPYTSPYDDVTITSIRIDSTGAYVDDNGDIVVNVKLEVSATGGQYEMASFKIMIYNGSGTLIDTEYINLYDGATRWITFSGADNDTYYVECK